MHLGPICTWDHDGLGTYMHIGLTCILVPSVIWSQVRHIGLKSVLVPSAYLSQVRHSAKCILVPSVIWSQVHDRPQHTCIILIEPLDRAPACGATIFSKMNIFFESQQNHSKCICKKRFYDSFLPFFVCFR
jgi:hypothetical protein